MPLSFSSALVYFDTCLPRVRCCKISNWLCITYHCVVNFIFPLPDLSRNVSSSSSISSSSISRPSMPLSKSYLSIVKTFKKSVFLLFISPVVCIICFVLCISSSLSSSSIAICLFLLLCRMGKKSSSSSSSCMLFFPFSFSNVSLLALYSGKIICFDLFLDEECHF